VFDVELQYGDRVELPAHTDGGAIERNIVSVSYISSFVHEPRTDMSAAEGALTGLVG
jgi:hypothetical protein